MGAGTWKAGRPQDRYRCTGLERACLPGEAVPGIGEIGAPARIRHCPRWAQGDSVGGVFRFRVLPEGG